METLAGNLTFANTIRLTKEDNEFKIIWTSNTIFPGLSATDKIKIDATETERGSIYDRNGKLLAGEGKTSNIGFVPGKMNKNPEKDIERVAELLKVSVDGIKNLLSADYVKEDTFVQIANISENDKWTEKELMKIAGIRIKNSAGRIYPYSDEISHLIGYVKKIDEETLASNRGKGYNSESIIGETGLEKAYEDRLRGVNGYEVYITDKEGRNKKKTIISRAPKKGDDIKLTIDIDIQKQVYQQFKNDESATVILNPKTGEILAMCSTPTYDANAFILGMTNERWQSIISDQKEPLFNRCTGAWVPGSSLKSIIGAIALTNNSISADEDFGKSGKKWQKDTTWGTYHVTTVKQYNGPANLRNGLVYSDNIYFAKVALKIGKDTLKNELNRLGFNKQMDFPQALTMSKFSGSDNFESEVQLADTGYGQGKVLVNPLHMAAMYTAFVNDGDMIKPYIEYKEDTSSPEYMLKGAFTKEAANTIKEDLIQVIEDEGGTAHNVKMDNITIAGKTGTAEIKESQEDTQGTEIGWFNAFVADENSEKQILIVSMVEDIKDRTEAKYVTTRVKRILQKIL
ncbi:MAG: penicillin-binding protein 2 [Clostridia bacterium]|nr:penicillin-binding protein 2 [Clostridia bacterium]